MKKIFLLPVVALLAIVMISCNGNNNASTSQQQSGAPATEDSTAKQDANAQPTPTSSGTRLNAKQAQCLKKLCPKQLPPMLKTITKSKLSLKSTRTTKAVTKSNSPMAWNSSLTKQVNS